MKIWQNLILDNLPGEIWKDIQGYENFYQVSNLGRIKSLKRFTKTKRVSEKILRQSLRKTGYLQVKLCNKGSTYHPVVNRLVAEAFLEKPNYKYVTNHINNIRDDNQLKNLELMSQSENIRYSYKQNRSNQSGEKNNNAKISEELVKKIRDYFSNNKHLSQKEIAKHFSLKREHVKDIITYKTWKNI